MTKKVIKMLGAVPEKGIKGMYLEKSGVLGTSDLTQAKLFDTETEARQFAAITGGKVIDKPEE